MEPICNKPKPLLWLVVLYSAISIPSGLGQNNQFDIKFAVNRNKKQKTIFERFGSKVLEMGQKQETNTICLFAIRANKED